MPRGVPSRGIAVCELSAGSIACRELLSARPTKTTESSGAIAIPHAVARVIRALVVRSDVSMRSTALVQHTHSSDPSEFRQQWVGESPTAKGSLVATTVLSDCWILLIVRSV